MIPALKVAKQCISIRMNPASLSCDSMNTRLFIIYNVIILQVDTGQGA